MLLKRDLERKYLLYEQLEPVQSPTPILYTVLYDRGHVVVRLGGWASRSQIDCKAHARSYRTFYATSPHLPYKSICGG